MNSGAAFAVVEAALEGDIIGRRWSISTSISPLLDFSTFYPLE